MNDCAHSFSILSNICYLQICSCGNIFSVENLGYLFQRHLACLNVKEIDDDHFHRQETAVEDVIAPVYIVKGDWIDVLIKK